jgi:tryptophan synthase beta chain
MKYKNIYLPDGEHITQWYNILPDIPNGVAPPLDPETKQPMSPEKLAPVFHISPLKNSPFLHKTIEPSA